MATFTKIPSYSSSLTLKPRILEAKFGGGYEQSIGDGINNKPRIFTLTFDNLTETEGNLIESFFDDNNTATTPFDWTPPAGASPGRFKCKEFSRVYKSGLTTEISCMFEEVFF